jgi:hypothetical protein
MRPAIAQPMMLKVMSGGPVQNVVDVCLFMLQVLSVINVGGGLSGDGMKVWIIKQFV